MKTTVVILCAPLLLMGAPAHAKDLDKVMMYGAGNQSCGTWTEARKQPNSWEAIANQSWVQGFLSAMSALSPSDFEKTDTAGINAFMDKYCAEHPLKNFSFGAASLIGALRIRDDH